MMSVNLSDIDMLSIKGSEISKNEAIKLMQKNIKFFENICKN